MYEMLTFRSSDNRTLLWRTNDKDNVYYRKQCRISLRYLRHQQTTVIEIVRHVFCKILVGVLRT